MSMSFLKKFVVFCVILGSYTFGFGSPSPECTYTIALSKTKLCVLTDEKIRLTVSIGGSCLIPSEVTMEGEIPGMTFVYKPSLKQGTLTGIPAESGLYFVTFHCFVSTTEVAQQDFVINVSACSGAKNVEYTRVTLGNGRVLRSRAKCNNLPGITYADKITWDSPPENANIVEYQIFSGNLRDLISQIPSNGKRRFTQTIQNVDPNIKPKYFVVAIDDEGNPSRPVKAKRKVKHHCH